MPPDLEPASALASAIENLVPGLDRGARIAALIEADRAAVREQDRRVLLQRIAELQFVDEAARALLAKAERDSKGLVSSGGFCSADFDALDEAVKAVSAQTDALEKLKAAVREPLERRIAELESGLRGYAHDESHVCDSYARAVADLEQARDRSASLEAQLASARELPKKWRGEASAYPNTNEGAHAAMAVRLCAREVEKLLTSPPKSPWIPVEERLPPNSAPVQVVCGGVVQLVPWRYFAFSDSWSCAVEVNGDDEAGPDAFSHWAPLLRKEAL